MFVFIFNLKLQFEFCVKCRQDKSSNVAKGSVMSSEKSERGCDMMMMMNHCLIFWGGGIPILLPNGSSVVERIVMIVLPGTRFMASNSDGLSL